MSRKQPPRPKSPFGPFGTPIGKPAPPLTIAPCCRCGQACMIRQDTQQFQSGQVFLRPATTTRGMCRECATHWWLHSIDGIRWAMRDANTDMGVLIYPNVQAAMNNILGMMHPELAGCDWERLFAQKDLPWPDDWALPTDTDDEEPNQ